MSAPRVLAEKGTFRKPCTASVCSRAWEPAAFRAREMLAISVTPPVSLFTSISVTSTVSSRRASSTACTETEPSFSGWRRVTAKPRLSSSSRLLRTASCSTREEITCRPFRFMASAPPRMAQLSLSEPQEVKTNSPGAQPRASATCFRLLSSSFFASRPRMWVELGLP